jgi:1,2-diacylglycerol 3-alpha-glucosyltransferase
MRIGIFTETYTPYISGLVTSEVMLKKALERLGHEVYVVTANLENFHYSYDEKERILRIPGMPTGIYETRLTSFYPFRAVNIIKNWNLDVIHTQTEFAIGTFARVIGKQFEIPVVHTYHTMYEDYVQYITKGYFDDASRKIVQYITKFYCDKTIQELIVTTKKTYDLFKKKYKYDRNVHIIPTGIEIERFYKENIDQNKLKEIRKQLGYKESDVIILYLGRIGYEKNIDFLIKNHSTILKKRKNAKLLIVGDGPDLDKYKKMAEKQKISDSVKFTGKVDWDSTKYYYNLADIFVTASDTETQGLTVVEALASSVPVVALDDEAFRTVVIDGLCGYLFKNKNEYVDRVLELIDDKNLRVRMGSQGRINAEPFSSRYFAERVLDVYRIALNGKPVKEKKTFFSRLKNIIKNGIRGK